MSASFKRIDYSLRPAKHAERRMFCDVFRRLKPFGPVEDYVYVGFGSVWFSDFILFHKTLGIKEMVSIEQATTAAERIEDNKPFRINVDFRPSNQALPELDWSKNTFLWLDYDDPLTTDILQDMRIVTARANSGTVLAVSVQCMKAPQLAGALPENDQNAPTGLQRFVNTFGRERVPADVQEDQLYGWLFGKLSRKMLVQEIESILATRNSDRTNDNIAFTPICAIEYEDGAKMTSIIGIFHSEQDRERLNLCHFESLDFLQKIPAGEAVRITVPKITAQEFKKLERQLPLPAGSQLNLGSIPKSEAKSFEDLYRYLPNFAVLEN